MKLVKSDNENVKKLINDDNFVLGQWVWVDGWGSNPETAPGLGHDEQSFVCIVEIGSNYIKVQAPRSQNSYREERIHVDEISSRISHESDPSGVLAHNVKYYLDEVRALLSEVRAITDRLGISPEQNRLSDGAQDTSNALVILSSENNIEKHKRSLIKAKEESLPALFKKLKSSNEKVAMWMSADTLSLTIKIDELEESIDVIDQRIFNVSIYAGLAEEGVHCVKGEPADIDSKLHVLQRRLYMDEESLINYSVGGMDFESIEAFDAWLGKSENLHRVLPFERSIVSMRVRRYSKERGSVSLRDALINVNFDRLDKMTFLYIRNGENLYRLNSELDFGELIFPEKALFTDDEPMMIKTSFDKVEQFMTVREYESILLDVAKWKEANKDKSLIFSPFSYSFVNGDWEPFNETSVHYDDALKHQKKVIAQYNRVALLIQGLFDRSKILHPHRPVKSWTPEGFAQAIELVYDGSDVMHYSDAPDFESYRQRCNALIDKDSVLFGQENYWLKREAEKEIARISRSRHSGNGYHPTIFRPYGNPGPGRLAKLSCWKPKAKKAVFSWNRDRLNVDRYSCSAQSSQIRTTVTVPADELLNISAYKPGDYKQFFADSRTREAYLKWAPALIAAEEYHAGNIEVSEPVD